MKRVVIALFCLAFLAALVVGAGSPNPKHGGQPGVVATVGNGDTNFDPIAYFKKTMSRYSRTELDAGVVVGSEFCIACHGPYDPEVAEWRDTNHAHALRKPMGVYSLQPGKGVLADFDHNGVDDFIQGLDFNTLSSLFDAQKPNAPILSYDAASDGYYIQLGPGGLKLQLAATWSGMSEGNGQRYMVRVPVADTDTGYSRAIYFGPFAWGGTTYSSNTSNWYTGNTPKYAPGIASSALVPLQGQNYLKNCAGCHITGIRKTYVTAAGEYILNPFPAALVPQGSPNYPDIDGDGIPDVTNIGCESCHGPGSNHILGGGDPAKIVNPVDIVAGPGYAQANQARSAICFQCHVQTGSFPNQTWGFTYDETNNKGFFVSNPMPDLTLYQKSKAVKWPDGVHYSTARIDSYYSAAHYEGSHGIACNDCHNLHSETQNPAQVRDTIVRSGVTTANANVDDDSFCLSCHAGRAFPTFTKQDVADWKAAGYDAPIPDAIRNGIEAHTHHPYGANRELGLSSCVGCHYANGHDAWVAKPEDTIAFKDVVTSSTVKGNPNGCSTECHRGRAIVWTDVPANLTYTDKLYNTDNEIKLANHLVTYFGPGGLWWDTTPAAAKGEKASTTTTKAPQPRHASMKAHSDYQE